MRTFVLASILAGLLVVTARAGFAQDQLGPDIERNRLAQTGMKFLSTSVDPRAAAMASAATTLEGSSAALFYNPAGMSELDNSVDVSLGQVQWVADYRYNVGSAAFRPSNGQYGVFGVTFLMVEYGSFESTIRADNDAGYIDIGSISPSALSAGIAYARTLTDRFSVGGHVKYVRQSLGMATLGFDDSGQRVESENTLGTPAVDFGVIYDTGFRSLNIALSARNFSQEVTYAEESFELPLSFNIGVSMDLMDLAPTVGDGETHSFLLAIDAQRPRDYYEQLKIGGEYQFMDILSLRAGYVAPADEQGLSVGGGLHLGVGNIDFRANYAFTQFGRLGNVNRIGVRLGI